MSEAGSVHSSPAQAIVPEIATPDPIANTTVKVAGCNWGVIVGVLLVIVVIMYCLYNKSKNDKPAETGIYSSLGLLTLGTESCPYCKKHRALGCQEVSKYYALEDIDKFPPEVRAIALAHKKAGGGVPAHHKKGDPVDNTTPGYMPCDELTTLAKK